jgi:hypothetical protein
MRAIFYVYRDYDTVPYKSSVTPYRGMSQAQPYVTFITATFIQKPYYRRAFFYPIHSSGGSTAAGQFQKN